MSDPCALCGEPATDAVTLPMDWVDYLRTERDMDPPIGTVRAPLCSEHFIAVDRKREAFTQLGQFPEERRAEIMAEIDDILDSLDLDALDEYMPGGQ